MARRKRAERTETNGVTQSSARTLPPNRTIGLAVLALSIAVGGAGWWMSRTESPDRSGQHDSAAPPQSNSNGRPADSSVVLPQLPFRDVTRESGIDFVHENGAAGEKLLPETMGGGVGVLDFNGDGHMDVLFVNSKRWPWDAGRDAPPATCRLYANDGTGHFTDATQAAGLDVELYGMGCAVGDYDNDGDPDVYLSAVGSNRLLRNDGGRFVDVTATAGVAGPADAWGTSCGWFDYDGDGRLDLFVGNYVVWNRELDAAQNFRLRGGGRAYGRPQPLTGIDPLLFRNRGDGTFEDASASSGLGNVSSEGESRAKTLGVTFGDFDGDGDFDVVVANDTVPNLLFENRGDGTFAEIGQQAGIALDTDGNIRGAMGVDAATFLDGTTTGIVIGNFANEMTALYVAPRGSLNFTDRAIEAGLGRSTRRELTFGVLFADFDLDGRRDCFATNGHLEPEVNRVLPGQHYEQAAQFFWNCSDDALKFRELTPQQVGDDLLRPIVGRGSACADFDGDGDLDLVVTAAGKPARLYRNDLAGERRWLRLKLVGSTSNRDAVGAVVTVSDAGRRQTGTVMPTRSYLSQSEPVVTFGFGNERLGKPIEQVDIRWPSGRTTTLRNVEPNRRHVIEEP